MGEPIAILLPKLLKTSKEDVHYQQEEEGGQGTALTYSNVDGDTLCDAVFGPHNAPSVGVDVLDRFYEIRWETIEVHHLHQLGMFHTTEGVLDI